MNKLKTYILFINFIFCSLFGMKLDTPQNISDFIAQNYPNLEKCYKELKYAMEIRQKEILRIIEDGNNNIENNLKFLLDDEFTAENKAYNLFWNIDNEDEINIDKNIKKIEGTINYFVEWCKNKYPNFRTFSEKKNNDYFYYMGVKLSKEYNMENAFIITDNHTSKILPLAIRNSDQKEIVTFYLGDTLDRVILKKDDNINNVEVQYFLFKKYCTLFMIKLFKMITLYENLFENQKEISDKGKSDLEITKKSINEKFFAVLGNHDFNSEYSDMLIQDFNKIEYNKDFVLNKLSLLAKFFIPIELIVEIKDSNTVHRLTHSGGGIPLNKSLMEYRTRIKDGGAYRVLVNFGIEDAKDNLKLDINALKAGIPESPSNSTDSTDSTDENNFIFQTWCDFDKEKFLYEYKNGRHSCNSTTKKMFSEWNQKNYELPTDIKIIDYRGHQHTQPDLTNYFIKNNNNYQNLNEVGIFWDDNLKFSLKSDATMHYLPPVAFDNQYCKCFFSNYQIIKKSSFLITICQRKK